MFGSGELEADAPRARRLREQPPEAGLRHPLDREAHRAGLALDQVGEAGIGGEAADRHHGPQPDGQRALAYPQDDERRHGQGPARPWVRRGRRRSELDLDLLPHELRPVEEGPDRSLFPDHLMTLGSVSPMRHPNTRLEHASGAGRRVQAFAPGRVNLIGEHTDYNDGLCLPFAVDRGVTVTAEAVPGTAIEAYADDLGERDRFEIGAEGEPSGGWRSFVRGASAELCGAG